MKNIFLVNGVVGCKIYWQITKIRDYYVEGTTGKILCFAPVLNI